MPWQSPISPGISWYEATVGERPEYASLDGSLEADVAIVGGGFTGLHAALNTIERGAAGAGVEVVGTTSGRDGGEAAAEGRRISRAPDPRRER